MCIIENLIFGGSFNPPHIGHILKADRARKKLQIRNLIFMPTYKHPWGKDLIDGYHRLFMLYLSVKDMHMTNTSVSSFEIDNRIYGGTYDTLIKFFNKHSYLTTLNTAYLIGGDQAEVFHKWKDWQKLIDLIPFVVITRHQDNKIPNCFYEYPHLIINDDEYANISSTNIRNSIKLGDYPTGMLTKSTLNYIEDNKLYEGIKI